MMFYIDRVGRIMNMVLGMMIIEIRDLNTRSVVDTILYLTKYHLYSVFSTTLFIYS